MRKFKLLMILILSVFMFQVATAATVPGTRYVYTTVNVSGTNYDLYYEATDPAPVPAAGSDPINYAFVMGAVKSGTNIDAGNIFTKYIGFVDTMWIVNENDDPSTCYQSASCPMQMNASYTVDSGRHAGDSFHMDISWVWPGGRFDGGYRVTFSKPPVPTSVSVSLVKKSDGVTAYPGPFNVPLATAVSDTTIKAKAVVYDDQTPPKPMTGRTVTYEVTSATSGVDATGISIDASGNITILPTAGKAGTTTFTVRAIDSASSLSGTTTFNLIKQNPVTTKISYTMSNNPATVPIAGSANVVSQVTDLHILDQYDMDMVNPTVTYSAVIPESRGVAFNTANGDLNISSIALDGKHADITVTSGGVSKLQTVNWNRSPSAPASLDFSMSPTKLNVPPTGSADVTSSVVGVVARDQYNEIIDATNTIFTTSPTTLSGAPVYFNQGAKTLTVKSTAPNGSIDIIASLGGATKTVTVPYTKLDPIPSAIEFSYNPNHVIVPTTGSNTATPLNLKAYDQYGSPMSASGMTFQIVGVHSSSVNIDSATGIVTVDSGAQPDDFVKVRATLGTKTKDLDLGYSRTGAIASRIAFTMSQSKLHVPAVGQQSVTSKVVSPTVWDQYNNVISNPTITYTFDPAVEPTGVHYNTSTGAVTVDESAASAGSILVIANSQIASHAERVDYSFDPSVPKSITFAMTPTDVIISTTGATTSAPTNVVILDQYGDPMTETEAGVTYSLVSTTPANPNVTWSAGVLTVGINTQPGTAIIRATTSDPTVYFEKPVYYSRSGAVATTLDFTMSERLIMIPATGAQPISSIVQNLVVRDQYGNTMSNTGVTYTLATPAPAGVTFNSTNGSVTVSSSVANSGSVDVIATLGGASKTVTVVFTGSKSVPKSITLDYSNKDITIPATGTVSTFPINVVVTDTNDLPMSSQGIVYTIGVSPAQVVIDLHTGILTIGAGAPEGTVIVTATIGGKSYSVPINYTKAPSVPDTISFAMDNSPIVIPTDSIAATSHVIGLVVRDQYGDRITSPTVTFSTVPAVLPTGVTFDSNSGTVSVGESANPGLLVIQATSGSITKAVYLSYTKIDAEPTKINLSMTPTKVNIPMVGTETASVQNYEVLDQYDVPMLNVGTKFSLETPVKGVTIDEDSGLVTIDSTATEGQVVVVASFQDVTGKATIDLQNVALMIQPKDLDALYQLQYLYIGQGQNEVTANYGALFNVYDAQGKLLDPQPQLDFDALAAQPTPYSNTKSTGKLRSLRLELDGIEMAPNGVLTANNSVKVTDVKVHVKFRSVAPFEVPVTIQNDNSGGGGLPDPTKDPDVIALINAQHDIAERFAKTQMSNVTNRLNQLHDRENSSSLNFTLENALVPLDQIVDMPKKEKLNYWGTGTVSFGDTEKDITFDTYLFSGGIDYKFNPKFTAGFGFGFGTDETKVGSKGSGVHSDGQLLTLYSSYSVTPKIYIDAMFGYSQLAFETERLAKYQILEGLGKGRREGSQMFGSLIAGYDYKYKNFTITPYFKFDAIDTTLDKYKESADLGVMLLAYDEEKFRYMSQNLGVRTVYELIYDKYTLVPNFEIEYGHSSRSESKTSLKYYTYEELDPDPTHDYSYSYVTEGSSSSETNIGIGTDIVKNSNGATLGIKYKYQISDNTTSQSVGLSLSVKF